MKYAEWFTYECAYGRHSYCHEGEDWESCDCRCHVLGDDAWWNIEPEDEEPE
jgi:hypothetical protein